MARKPIKHARIQNEKLKKSTLKRRLDSLYKKANELSILCNVEIFIAILNPSDRSSALWPSCDKVTDGFMKFLDSPEPEMLRKMVLQEKLLADKVQEMGEKLWMLRKKNEETEMRILMKQVVGGRGFAGLDLEQVNGLKHLIDEDLNRLQKRRNELDEAERQGSGTSVFAGGNRGGELAGNNEDGA